MPVLINHYPGTLVIENLRLRDTYELILWALISIVLKSSLFVFCIEWSGYHLQSTV